MKLRKLVSGVLLPLMLLTACGSSMEPMTHTVDLRKKPQTEKDITINKTDSFLDAQYQFSISMLQAAVRQNATENLAFSPLSAAYSLAAAGLGAAGETGSEITAAFGGMDISALTEQLGGWAVHQNTEQLSVASSVWFQADSGFKLPEVYSQNGLSCVEIYAAPFDETTLSDMNKWCRNKTGGKITNLIEQLEPDEILDLLGVMSFEAEWASPYADNEVRNERFFAADGSQQNAKFMFKEFDKGEYLSDSKAVGLLRGYEGNRYAFGAVMPLKMSLNDYIASLTPESFRKLIQHGKQVEIDTSIPQFSIDSALNMKDVLMDMGICTAFDREKADFSGLRDSESRLWLSRAVSQVKVQVDRHGTKASYAINISGEESACSEYRVGLNKPFIWFIYDTQYGMPVMLGTLQSIK